MPRIPNKKRPAKRGRGFHEISRDLRQQLDSLGEDRKSGWTKIGEAGFGPDCSVQAGPTLALLQERLAVSIDQVKKQFDRLSQLADRICGPGTQPAGEDARNVLVPGGQLATLNAQLNVMDQIMARVDDQITRLETL